MGSAPAVVATHRNTSSRECEAGWWAMTGARSGRSVLVLIGAIAVAAVAVWLAVAVINPQPSAVGEVWWPLLILGFAVAELAAAHVEYQGEAHVWALVEV